MWKLVGDKLVMAIIKMNIPMEDLPWIDGRLNVYEFLETWQKGLKHG